MHPCTRNWEAIGRVVVNYAWASDAFIVEIKCRHCTFLNGMQPYYMHRGVYQITKIKHLSIFQVAVSSFAAYVISSPDNMLDAEKIFVSLSLFNILRVPLTHLPGLIKHIVQVRTIEPNSPQLMAI